MNISHEMVASIGLIWQEVCVFGFPKEKKNSEKKGEYKREKDREKEREYRKKLDCVW